MDAASQSAETLRKQIAATEEQLRRLKEQLASVEAFHGVEDIEIALGDCSIHDAGLVTNTKWPLSPEEYQRYGRQMIVPNIGIQG
jgi:adenylyltransferase/sulfurtransferase